MRILAFGRSEFFFDTVRELAHHFEVVGLITAPSRPESQRREEDFRRLTEEIGCPFALVASLRAAQASQILALPADVAVSVNWVSVVGKDVISRFRFGVLNAHFGDLPRYRGNAVTNWAILRGETEIMVTIHQMEAGELDSGPIVVQERVPLHPTSTIADVNRTAQELVPGLFVRALRGLADGNLQTTSQDARSAEAFRCFPRLPVDSVIRWPASANEIDRLVRASTRPYSGAYTAIWARGEAPQRLVVWESRVVADSTADVGSPGHVIRNDAVTGESWIFTGSGIVALRSVQLDGGDPFAPGTRWKSTRMRLGLPTLDAVLDLYRRLDAIERALGQRG